MRLQPQPARVLALLLERPGEIVSREDLRRHVWGNETFVDFERGLNFCIAQIRSALGDSADSPRYVETVPKRGYRFIAPATSTDNGGAGLKSTPEPVSGGAGLKTRPSKLQAGTLAALVIALAAGAGAFVLVRQRVAVPPASVPIAVVPFDNQTGSIAFDAIAEGLADSTVARLAQSDRPRLAVVGNAAPAHGEELSRRQTDWCRAGRRLRRPGPGTARRERRAGSRPSHTGERRAPRLGAPVRSAGAHAGGAGRDRRSDRPRRRAQAATL